MWLFQGVIEMQKDAIQQDQKVIILDDAIATGGKPHAHLAVAYQHPCEILLFCQMVVSIYYLHSSIKFIDQLS